MSIRLSKVAPWNPRLRNGYRDRFAEVNGRYFKVSADSLDAMWWVEEIDAEGEAIFDMAAFERGENGFKFGKWAMRLSEAREIIEEETS